MTVNAPGSTDFAKYYDGDDAQTAFTFDFPVTLSTELIVEKNNVIQSSGYTVADPFPIGESGSTVNFAVAPTSSDKIAIYRKTQTAQGADIGNTVTFDEQEVEDVFDKLMRIVQDNARRIEKSFRVADGSQGTSLSIPTITASDSGKVLVVNAGGTGFDLSTTDLDDLDSQVAAAATSATNAAASATAASSSASAASSSASAASASATAASTSETNASNSETKASEWADKAEDSPVETGPNRYSALHHAAKAEDSAQQASTTASNLAETLSGNYILRSNPSVDVNNEFQVTNGMKADMESNDVAVIPSSGLTVTYEAYLRNGTASAWGSISSKIKSPVYDLEINGVTVSAGTDVNIDADYDGASLYLYFNPAKNKVIIEKFLGN